MAEPLTAMVRLEEEKRNDTFSLEQVPARTATWKSPAGGQIQVTGTEGTTEFWGVLIFRGY